MIDDAGGIDARLEVAAGGFVAAEDVGDGDQAGAASVGVTVGGL